VAYLKKLLLDVSGTTEESGINLYDYLKNGRQWGNPSSTFNNYLSMYLTI